MRVRRGAFFQRAAAATAWLLLCTVAGHARDLVRQDEVGRGVDPLGVPDTQLEPLQWSDVDGWDQDDQSAAFTTFMTSCRPFLVRKRAPNDSRPIFNALWRVCRRAADAGPLGKDKLKARTFFEHNFEPVRIAKLGETTGLLTGYYEPVVDGSRFPNPEFHTPVYRRPPDLVMLGQPKPKTSLRGKAKVVGPAFPNRGTVGRLNNQKKLEPYYDRGAIEAGALDGRHLEICWIREPFDLMNIQIQGSARVRLEDGTMLRLGYDAHNGFSYSAVGRVLIERNLVPRDEMSMDRIRRWMHDNPAEAKDVRQTNKSYVFFRITGLSDDSEPTGGQGVPLTAGRSIAVDKIHVYGTPFFIEATLPIDNARPTTKFRRLMIAQDTGSAITGPARADLYWGAGDEAAKIAGRIRQHGQFVMLVPRELDMIEAGKDMPLPPVKPIIPDAKDAKADNANKDAKKEAGSADGKIKDTKVTNLKNEKTKDQKVENEKSDNNKAKNEKLKNKKPEKIKDDRSKDQKAKDNQSLDEKTKRATEQLVPATKSPEQGGPDVQSKKKTNARRDS